MNTQNLTKVETAFFEVEGIKKVFEGIYLGVFYSYGREAYFTKEVCFDIIDNAQQFLNVRFDESEGTFIETWYEKGEMIQDSSDVIEVFGTKYYSFGNGWAWEFSYKEKNDLYNMNTKRLEEKLGWLGSFYDIWQKSQAIDDSAIDNLSQVYVDYCNEWGLPQMSCDELICEILSILND